MRGLKNAKEYHDNNSGLPYNVFKLAKSGDSAIVRIIQPDDEWVNFFVHQKWVGRAWVLSPTRCPSDDLQRNPDECPLCALGQQCPRALRTFIPVRVRGIEDPSRVDIITYGRDGLDAIINIIEDLPQGVDITMVDCRIKRKGEELDTTYFWSVVGTPRPLNGEEKALEIPNMEELWAFESEIELDRRARQFAQSMGVAPVDGAGVTAALGVAAAEEEEIPF